MKLVHGDPVIQWVAERLPMVGADGFGPAKGFGVVTEEDKLIGGVILHCWRPKLQSIEASFASVNHRWLTRPIICRILNYAYYDLDCIRITATTPKKYRPARRFLERFGFKIEGNLRRGFVDDDCIVSGLLREEWEASRWMRGLSVVKTQGVRTGRDGDSPSANDLESADGCVQSTAEHGELLRA